VMGSRQAPGSNDLGVDLGVRHREAWARSAIVTDTDWIARATGFRLDDSR